LTNGDNEELIKQLNDWSNRFKPVISDIHDTLERIFTLEKMGQIWQPGARFELRVYSDNMLGFASIINGEESIVNFAIRRDGTYSIKSIDESTRGEVHNSVPLNLTSQLSNVRLGAALIHALNATLQIHPQSFSTAASSSTQKQTTAEVGGSVAMGSASSSSGGQGFRKVAWAE
jgi:hypothetical protein